MANFTHTFILFIGTLEFSYFPSNVGDKLVKLKVLAQKKWVLEGFVISMIIPVRYFPLETHGRNVVQTLRSQSLAKFTVILT